MKDILIVEDGRGERERLKILFEEAGYLVTACESVTEAENCLENETFRLAVLDIGLNDKSGSHIFHLIKKSGTGTYTIIFTGNPSVHLKQRFIDEGAADYIVKASPQATNQAILARVQEIIGTAQPTMIDGVPLDEFVKYITASSKKLFLDMKDAFPPCSSCGSLAYVVTFSHQPQIPPEVLGQVVCGECGKGMDPEVE